MANVGQVATAELVLATGPAPGRAARIFGFVAVGLALSSALLTFLVLANLTPVPPTDPVVRTLLTINAATILLLIVITLWEVWRIVQARRRGRAAARLHVRIVALFSVIAALPAILMASVASITLDRGLDRLFSTRTQSIIENSLAVADAYLQEHAQMIRGSALTFAVD